MANGRQREVLEWMLCQIDRAERHKRQLDERLHRILEERNAPIGGIGYDPMPRSSGTGSGAASITLKLADIEDRIYKQKDEIEKCYVRVSEILEYLPVNSLEREVCELRYLDMKKWDDVSDMIPMARSKCIEHKNKALDILLEYPRIRKMIRDNEPSYLEYAVKHDAAVEKRKRERAKYKDQEKSVQKSSGGYKPGDQNGIGKQARQNGKARRS